MISFIQKILQKHSKWMLVMLLFVIVIPFVFTIGNSPGIGWFRKKSTARTFFGYDLNNPKVVGGIVSTATLSYFLNTGEQPRSNQQFQGYLLARLLNLHFADEFQVPLPTEQRLKAFIETRGAFRDEKSGSFSVEKYNRYLKNAKENSTTSSQRSREVLMADCRAEDVEKLLFRTPGYVLPIEVEIQWKMLHTQWSLCLARLSLSSFQSQVTASEDKIKQYYKGNAARYQGARKFQISYVPFRVNIKDVPDPKEDELKAFFKDNESLFKPQNTEIADKSNPVAQEISFDSCKDRVKEAYINQQADVIAEAKANDFVFELYNKDIKVGSQKFVEICRTVPCKSLSPFSEDQLPGELNMPQDVFLQTIGSLDNVHYYSDPVRLKDSFVVLLLEKKIPPVIEPLDAVRETVVKDFRTSEAARLYNQKKSQLLLSLGSSKTLEAFKRNVQSAGLSLETFEKFTMDDPPKNLPQEIFSSLNGLNQGSVSNVIDIDDQRSAFVFVNQKFVADAKKDDPSLTTLYTTQQMINSILGANEVRNAFITSGMNAMTRK
jgi:peptidyl-prolyl cis-trans isomerase D